MKKVLALMLFAGLFATACSNVDEELMGKMEASKTKISGMIAGLKTSAQKVDETFREMEAAPEGLKASPNFGFMDAYNGISAINGRYNNMLNFCNQATAQLDSLITNYNEGKLKTEEVKAAYDAIASSGMDRAEESLARMTTYTEELATKFAKMKADWEALPEDQRRSMEAKAAMPRLQGAPGASAQPGAGLRTNQ